MKPFNLSLSKMYKKRMCKRDGRDRLAINNGKTHKRSGLTH